MGAVRAKYVISLASDEDRRGRFFAQPESAGFEIIDAVDLRGAGEDRVREHFDVDRFVDRYRRRPAAAEAGCSLSHLAFLKRVAADGRLGDDDLALVCEDDATFTPGYSQDFDHLAQGSFDILVLCFVRSAEHWMPRVPISPRVLPMPSGASKGTLWPNAGIGTVGYLVRKSAAKRLLRILGDDRPSWVADDYVFWRDQGARVWSTRPILIADDPDADSSIQDERGPLVNAIDQEALNSRPVRYVQFWHDRKGRKSLWFAIERVREALPWAIRVSPPVVGVTHAVDDFVNGQAPYEPALQRVLAVGRGLLKRD